MTYVEDYQILTKQSNKENKQEKSDSSIPNIPVILGDSVEQNEDKHYNDSYKSLKIESINWNNIIESMVNNILKEKSIELNSIIFINKIVNYTNNSFNLNYIDKSISDLFRKSKFTLVSNKQLLELKLKLGLSNQDSFNSLDKAIGIARNIGADYLLYSIILDDDNKSKIQLQLMSVNTGEIIWSDENFIYTNFNF